MERDLYWKNFALGHELDVSGNFIYNGIKSLDSLEHFYYPSDVFEILYNLSVGIECLLKVTIILMEHSEQTSMKSLKTHSTVELMDRVRLALGIDSVALSKQEIDAFMKKVKVDLPIMLDHFGQAVKDWGVYVYPSNFFAG